VHEGLSEWIPAFARMTVALRVAHTWFLCMGAHWIELRGCRRAATQYFSPIDIRPPNLSRRQALQVFKFNKVTTSPLGPKASIGWSEGTAYCISPLCWTI